MSEVIEFKIPEEITSVSKHHLIIFDKEGQPVLSLYKAKSVKDKCSLIGHDLTYRQIDLVTKGLQKFLKLQKEVEDETE